MRQTTVRLLLPSLLLELFKTDAKSSGTHILLKYIKPLTPKF